LRRCAPHGTVPGYQVGRARQLIGRVRHELLELPPRCARPQPVHPPSTDSRVTWSSPISTPGQRTKVEPGRKSVPGSSGSAPCHGCAIRQEPQRSVTVTPGCSSDPTSAYVSPAHARPGLPIFQAGDLGVRSACGKVRLPAVRNGLCRSLTAINRRSRWQAFPQVNALRMWWSGAGSNRRSSAFQADGPLGAAARDGSAGTSCP
jgi:hypothetical protein